MCFDKTTGDITGQLESACSSSPDHVWYADGTDEAQPVQISCNEPGALFVPIGCEPLCQSRVDNPTQYIINDGEFSGGNLRNLYDQNKELMQITSDRPDGNTPGDSEIPINIITDSPYNVQEDGGLDPINFGVTVDCDGSACSSNVPSGSGEPTVFGGDGEAFACNPNDENEERGSKYYVSGLFPTCSSDNEECLNFNITYTPEEYDADGETKPPFNLQELRDKLPIDIFQGDPSEGEIQKYRDSLYYFRGFKDSDGNYNVEGQIRCDIDQGSRYGCAIISSSLADVAGDDANAVAAAENIYETYFKPSGVEATYGDNLYALAPTDDQIALGVYNIFSSIDNDPARPDYLIQKNGFCYTDGGTGVTVRQGPRVRNDRAGKTFTPNINWDSEYSEIIGQLERGSGGADGAGSDPYAILMHTNLEDALVECNRTNGFDADGNPLSGGSLYHPCKYITHNKLNNKYYIHRESTDSYKGPSHFAIHRDYNCILRPETPYTSGEANFSGSYLMDGTENNNYIGYKNTNCMIGEDGAEELAGVQNETDCNQNTQCYGYQEDGDSTKYFKNYSGRMTMKREGDLNEDDLNNTTCYLKNSALAEREGSVFRVMSLPTETGAAAEAVRQAVRSVTDNWMTPNKKAPLQSYVLKTKNEIKNFIMGG